MATVPVQGLPVVSGLRRDFLHAAQVFARITVAALPVALITGLLSRFAMLLLARLNPAATGMDTDDGFPIGRFTLAGTLNLLLGVMFVSLMGVGCYAVLRGLMIGPRWFRVLSISLGPAVVVGSMLVHTTGVDFTVLEPPLLAIALFVALPMFYVALLTLTAEWVLATGRLEGVGWTVLGLLAWVPLAPLALAIGLGFLTWAAVRRFEGVGSRLTGARAAWVARGGLGAIFVAGLVDLVRDAALLV
jgi:hypothetical protein